MAATVAEEVRVENPEADYETLKNELKATTEDGAQLRAEEVVLRTRILNLSKDYIHRLDRKYWVGRPVTDRTTLASGSYAILTGQGPKYETVKFGEAWATGNESRTDRQWVFAFDSVRQRAYAQAGRSGPVDWDAVEEALVKSGSKSESDDPILGGKTVAEVDGTNAYATFR